MSTWNAALVFTFGPPVPGREAAALANFAEAQAFFGKLAAEGMCEAESYLWGFGGGLMIVKGDSPQTLHEILEMEESRRQIAAANFTTQDFHYQVALTGDRLAESMANYAEVGGALGYL